MKAKYYAAEDGIGMLHITATLGKYDVNISVANKKLDWISVRLNEEQIKGLIKFLNETPME